MRNIAYIFAQPNKYDIVRDRGGQIYKEKKTRFEKENVEYKNEKNNKLFYFIFKFLKKILLYKKCFISVNN